MMGTLGQRGPRELSSEDPLAISGSVGLHPACPMHSECQHGQWAIDVLAVLVPPLAAQLHLGLVSLGALLAAFRRPPLGLAEDDETVTDQREVQLRPAW